MSDSATEGIAVHKNVFVFAETVHQGLITDCESCLARFDPMLPRSNNRVDCLIIKRARHDPDAEHLGGCGLCGLGQCKRPHHLKGE